MDNEAEDLVKLMGCIYISMISALPLEHRHVANRTMRELADDVIFSPRICETLNYLADSARVATPEELEDARNEFERANRERSAIERRQDFRTVWGGNGAA
jgi:hypothetical protein